MIAVWEDVPKAVIIVTFVIQLLVVPVGLYQVACSWKSQKFVMTKSRQAVNVAAAVSSLVYYCFLIEPLGIIRGLLLAFMSGVNMFLLVWGKNRDK